LFICLFVCGYNLGRPPDSHAYRRYQVGGRWGYEYPFASFVVATNNVWGEDRVHAPQ
jgi:hypothetical protein